ncbi:MAG TPA: hypothetical protein DCX03_01630 [Bacteroidales bacterium]|nr:hypothetical protein [Bacteroidales bacterium]
MSAEHPIGPVKALRLPIFSEKITVTTDGSGNASVDSDNVIVGEILKISYVKGTVNAGTSAVLTFTTPATTVALDTYDVNTGSAERYPYVAPVGSTDAWVPKIGNSTITVTVTGGALSKTFYVYVYYR